MCVYSIYVYSKYPIYKLPWKNTAYNSWFLNFFLFGKISI